MEKEEGQMIDRLSNEVGECVISGVIEAGKKWEEYRTRMGFRLIIMLHKIQRLHQQNRQNML